MILVLTASGAQTYRLLSRWRPTESRPRLARVLFRILSTVYVKRTRFRLLEELRRPKSTAIKVATGG